MRRAALLLLLLSHTRTTDDLLSAQSRLEDTPEIASWLCSVCPQTKVTIGNYTYLDGALHVQLSLACDAIISKLAEQQGPVHAFLCTLTDVHTVPKAAYDAAKENMAKAPWWQKMSPFSLEPNAIEPVKTEDGSTVYIVDGIVADQGPNYILAKRLQHWRAILNGRAGTPSQATSPRAPQRRRSLAMPSSLRLTAECIFSNPWRSCTRKRRTPLWEPSIHDVRAGKCAPAVPGAAIGTRFSSSSTDPSTAARGAAATRWAPLNPRGLAFYSGQPHFVAGAVGFLRW